MNSFDVRRVTVVGVPIFTCSVCGRKGRGTTARVEFKEPDLGDIAEGLSSIHPGHLPSGWACYGREIIKCPEHKT